MGLPFPFRASARLQWLSTLLTHQVLVRLMRSRGTDLGSLFDHPRPQPIHLLIDGLFDLG